MIIATGDDVYILLRICRRFDWAIKEIFHS